MFERNVKLHESLELFFVLFKDALFFNAGQSPFFGCCLNVTSPNKQIAHFMRGVHKDVLCRVYCTVLCPKCVILYRSSWHCNRVFEAYCFKMVSLTHQLCRVYCTVLCLYCVALYRRSWHCNKVFKAYWFKMVSLTHQLCRVYCTVLCLYCVILYGSSCTVSYCIVVPVLCHTVS